MLWWVLLSPKDCTDIHHLEETNILLQDPVSFFYLVMHSLSSFYLYAWLPYQRLHFQTLLHLSIHAIVFGPLRCEQTYFQFLGNCLKYKIKETELVASSHRLKDRRAGELALTFQRRIIHERKA